MMKRPENISKPFQISQIWVVLIVLTLLVFFISTPSTYFKLDAVSIWVLSCIIILYLSTKQKDILTLRSANVVIILGIAACAFSFIAIPIGFSNPPYSIGELSILLSGLGLIYFGFFKLRSLLFPVAFPLIAVIGFQSYELFLRNQEWMTAPLIPFTVTVSSILLKTIGIPAKTTGNLISFISQNGDPIYLTIVSDCTGVMSLGTFTVAVLIVLTSFPRAITKKNLLFIGIGYIGTYFANLGRIVLIALSGYFFGSRGVIEHVHVHIGWIIFSIWMIIFWYYFFTRRLHMSFSNNKPEYLSENRK